MEKQSYSKEKKQKVVQFFAIEAPSDRESDSGWSLLLVGKIACGY